jgi:hypothetical protein
MADILCAVCSEPWDAYGVHHGDMLAWEARLFKQGAGCPSCEGKAPDGADADATALSSAETMASAWDDPHSFPHYNAMLGVADGAPLPVRPEWKEPDRAPVWTCAGCKAEAVRPWGSLCEPNKEPLEWNPGKGEKIHYAYGLPYRRGMHLDRNGPDETPHATIAGQTYCDACATQCDGPLTVAEGCAGYVLVHDEELDTYDTGKGFPGEDWHDGPRCLACYEHEQSERAQQERIDARTDAAREAWRMRESDERDNEPIRAMIAERMRHYR